MAKELTAAQKKAAALKVIADKKKRDEENAKPLPKFKDSEGQLKKLKGSDFPKSKAGKMAFCDYNILKWEIKKVAIEKGMDPAAKAKKRREKLLKQLATLDETIVEMDKEGK